MPIIDRLESEGDSSRDNLDKLLGRSNPSKDLKPNHEIDSTIRS